MRHIGQLRQRNGVSAVGRVFQTQFIGAGQAFREALHPGRQRLETHIQAQVVAIVGKSGDFLSVSLERNGRPLRAVAFQDQAVHREGRLHLQDSRHALAGFQRPGAGSTFQGPVGLDVDDPVQWYVRELQQLFGPVAFHILEMPFHILHALLRLNPGPAGLAPARAVEQADFNPQLPGRLEGLVRNVPPLIGEQRHRAVGIAFALVSDKRLVDAHPFHSFQVFHHAFLGNVVVHPIPVNGSLHRIRRRAETCFQGLPGAVCTANGQQGKTE